MPNYPYHFARLHGGLKRRIYRSLLKAKAVPCTATSKLPWQVYSFCGESGLPEQVASLRSFLTHAGAPVAFNVVSDGSIKPSSKSLLRRIHECVNVFEVNDVVPADLLEYGAINVKLQVMYKKVLLLLAISRIKYTLYTDSDILFFPGASVLLNALYGDTSAASYLLDCVMALDVRMLSLDVEKMHPVNSGFMAFRSHLDWSLSFERLPLVKDAPIPISEQTFVHLAMHKNDAVCLPVDQCINRCDDQFIYGDLHSSGNIAFRHYVGPVRHKFWVQVSFFV